MNASPSSPATPAADGLLRVTTKGSWVADVFESEESDIHDADGTWCTACLEARQIAGEANEALSPWPCA